VKEIMMRAKIAIALILVTLSVGSATFAETWNGLIVDGDYSAVSIVERSVGPFTGVIRQYTAGDQLIQGGGNVYYCLPQISWTTLAGKSYSSYGVCIDTNQYTGSPQQLRKGWDSPAPLQVNNVSRLNGTVKDFAAWERTTYLFGKHQVDLETWFKDSNAVQAAAFQLAIWEVMSGDGSTTGGNWGAGSFTAGMGSALIAPANAFVAEAYDGGFDAWQSGGYAESAYYLHDHQDFLVYVPTSYSGDPVVPEIPAVALGPLGLMAFGLLKRRFVK
jgi:hypothetical protein